jgi:hypothetical protein
LEAIVKKDAKEKDAKEMYIIDQARGIAIEVKVHDYPAKTIFRSPQSGRPLYMYLGKDV